VIHKLQIYRQAMVVETGLTTDDCDLVIGDLISAGRERGLITMVGTPLLYMSQLEVRLDSTLERACPISRAIGTRLSGILTQYAYRPPPFPMPHVFGIVMKPDPQQQQMPVTSESKNAKAPLTTTTSTSRKPRSEPVIISPFLRSLIASTQGQANKAQGFFQRAVAAFLAMAFRFLAERAFARA
jgi:hypothetical protein